MDNENFKKYFPYMKITGGFLAAMLLLFYLTDSWILPSLIHSAGKVSVPNITGMKFEDAKIKIENSGLKWYKSSEQYSEDYPGNHVINQIPKPNTIVKAGRHINLTISKGGESVVMPDVRLKSLRSARVNLMQIGLYIGNIEYAFNDSIGVDTVISQSIRSGKEISFGSYINLIISKGPEAEIEVPALSGKTLAEVEDILAGYGLILGSLSNSYDPIYADTYMRNTVVSQFPQPGDIVARNTPIDITIYR